MEGCQPVGAHLVERVEGQERPSPRSARWDHRHDDGPGSVEAGRTAQRGPHRQRVRGHRTYGEDEGAGTAVAGADDLEVAGNSRGKMRQGAVRLGRSRHGTRIGGDRPGSAGQGRARNMAGNCVACCGRSRHGTEQGMERIGSAGCGAARNMASQGYVWLVTARLGTRSGTARHGLAMRGMEHGLPWYGEPGQGGAWNSARLGLAWCGMARQGEERVGSRRV